MCIHSSMYLKSSDVSSLCLSMVFAATCQFPHYLRAYFFSCEKFQNAVKSVRAGKLATRAACQFSGTVNGHYFFVPSTGKLSMFNLLELIQSFSFIV